MNINKYIQYIGYHIGFHIIIKCSFILFFYIYAFLKIHSIMHANKNTKLYDYDASWDYYEFVQSWVPTYCLMKGNCNITLSKFIIHGLWPSRFDGTWPSYCQKIPFNKTSIYNITNKLKNDWSDNNSLEYSFWEHEWNKHGVCTDMNQYHYFNKTLQLYDKYNISNILLNCNITPSTSKFYPIDDIYTCLDKKYVYIDCYQYKNISYLSSVYYHLDKDYRFIKINKKLETCKNKIMYI